MTNTMKKMIPSTRMRNLVGGHRKGESTMTVERSTKMRAVERKRAAIDQGVAFFCNALRFIGDFWKTNHEWMDKIGNDDCGGATSSKSEILADAVLATLHGLISIRNGDDGGGNGKRRRAFDRLRLDSCSGKQWCFVLQVGATSVLSKLQVSASLTQVPPRIKGSDETSLTKQKLDDKREGDDPTRESLATPPTTKTSQNKAISPPLPPPAPVRKGSAPPPPPPAPVRKGSAPPPPPPPMGANKLTLPSRARPKLKRLNHIAALYRSVKEFMEGYAPAVQSTTKVSKSQLGGSQQGMADTIAEMKKKSAYHQQIESDVETYHKVIVALKDNINSFKTADMVELLKFHRFAESCLAKLTDESQVLARFEEFPISKLEAIRSATALYSKLNSFLIELKEWKISSPTEASLYRIGQYFDKMKREIEAVERRKDEDSKLFERNQIKFDYVILTRIKEAAVDVCSGCMELALKEVDRSKLVEVKEGRRKDGKNEMSNLLWRAVQFGFRVYSFAGGFDDRADKLIKALAREIEASFQAKAYG